MKKLDPCIRAYRCSQGRKFLSMFVKIMQKNKNLKVQTSDFLLFPLGQEISKIFKTFRKSDFSAKASYRTLSILMMRDSDE